MSYRHFDFLDAFLIVCMGLTCILAMALLTNNLKPPFTPTTPMAVTLTTTTTWNTDNPTTGIKRGWLLTLYSSFLPFNSDPNYVFSLNGCSLPRKMGAAPWFLTA
jgi:hypothetical protein